jgi:hypothetical protein
MTDAFVTRRRNIQEILQGKPESVLIRRLGRYGGDVAEPTQRRAAGWQSIGWPRVTRLATRQRMMGISGSKEAMPTNGQA